MSTREQGKNTRKKIYDFIVSYIKENNYPPTVREICNGTGLKSTSTVQSQLVTLAAMGVITHKESAPRTIKVLCELVEK